MSTLELTYKLIYCFVFGLLLNPYNLVVWIPCGIGLYYAKKLTTDKTKED